MKKLSLRASRRLVWTSWFELLVVGVVVYFFTNPLSIFLLLAGPFLLHALINVWVKSRYIPVRIYSVVPSVFLPTAFLAALGALVSALVSDEGMLSSLSLSLATVCVACFMLIYPESRYAGDWKSGNF